MMQPLHIVASVSVGVGLICLGAVLPGFGGLVVMLCGAALVYVPMASLYEP